MKKSTVALRITAVALASVLFCVFLFSCSIFKSASAGDCNSDGRSDARDANFLSRHVQGERISLSKEGPDLNSDGIISDADLSLLKEYLSETFRPGNRFSSIFINGLDIESYTLVIPKDANDFEKWTAQILSDSIGELCGAKLETVTDEEAERPCEILIGTTSRSESRGISCGQGKYTVFAGNDYYVAAGAGYILSALDELQVEWNLEAHIDIPRTKAELDVEWKEGKNVILLIGDGMGANHYKMATDEGCTVSYTDGIRAPEEKGFEIFWPSTFENAGDCITLNIQDSTTDSAAAATALSTGFKTLNGALGMIPADLDGDGEEDEFRSVQNVREAATLGGLATSVISTDRQTGGTPNAFLIHHHDRTEKKLISEQQKALDSTRLDCSYLWCSYDSDDVFKKFKKAIDVCDDNPGGFFMMTEEAMIDKYAEKMDYDNVIRTVKRLNTMTAYAATYAMCHRDTVIIVTADHETGGLTKTESGSWTWTSDGEHTSTNVPVFAMGYGTEYFDGQTRDNTDIARFLFDAVR